MCKIELGDIENVCYDYIVAQFAMIIVNITIIFKKYNETKVIQTVVIKAVL